MEHQSQQPNSGMASKKSRKRNKRRNKNAAYRGEHCTIFYLASERNQNFLSELNTTRCRITDSDKPMGSIWKKNGGKASRLPVEHERELITNWAEKSKGPLWLEENTNNLKTYQRNRFCDSRIKFGNMTDDTTFAEHFAFTVDFALFEHERNRLDVYLRGENDLLRYKISLRYRYSRFVAIDVSDDGVNLTSKQAFTMQGTPLIYTMYDSNYADQMSEASKFGLPLELEDIDIYRTLELDMELCPNSSPTMTKITSQDIGKCRTMLIEVGDQQTAEYNGNESQEDWTYQGIRELNRRLSKLNVNVYFCRLTIQSVTEYRDAKTMIWNDLLSITENNFEVLYLLNVLNSSEVLLDQLVLDGSQADIMFNIVREVVSSNDVIRFTEAIRETLSQRNLEAISIARTLKQCMEDLLNMQTDNRDSVPRIREIVLTPSYREYKLPVAYKLPKPFRNLNPDYLLEVTVRDDDGRTLKKEMLTHPFPESFLREFTANPLHCGLKIGNWLYKMIGWSDKQIRKSSFWMYCNDDVGLTARKIQMESLEFGQRNSLLSKCTRAMELLNDKTMSHQLRGVTFYPPDHIYSPQGRISSDLMIMFKGLEPECDPFMIPAAVSARIGNFRGIFVTDTSLPARTIKLSAPMCQSYDGYPLPYSMEATVFSFSRTKSCQLNRQMISLLERCGVQPEVFLDMESAEIVDALKIFLNSSTGWRTLQENSTFQFYDQLEKNVGASLSSNPFIRKLLQDILLSKLLRLEYKTFLSISIDQGCRLMGIVDETGILQRGEVYIRYSSGSNMSGTRTGKVLVTKTPCLEKGDIRIFDAVNSLEGTHFDFGNVIVFSSHMGIDTTGKQVRDWRLMGGYPLHDGFFTVLWSEKLLFNFDILPDTEPQRYRCQRKYYESQQDVFLDEIANPAVGIMCNMHLAHADHQITGNSPLQPQVLTSLAAKIRTQLRFWERGDRVKITRRERVNTYPDFMKRSHRECERSNSSLGQLYKLVSQLRRYLTVSRNHEPVNQNQFFEIEGWKTFEFEAIRLKEQFDSDLKKILKNWKLQNESELFLKTDGELSEVYSDWADTGFFGEEHRRCERAVIFEREKLFEKYREIFQQRLEPNSHLLDAEARFVSACFMVSHNRGRTDGFSSFPWIHAKFVNEYFLENPHPLARFRSPLLLNYQHLENAYDTKAAFNGIKNLLESLNGDIKELPNCSQYVSCLRDAIPDRPSECRPEGDGHLGCLMQFLENSCLRNRLQTIQSCKTPLCIKYLATSQAIRTVMFKPLIKVALFWDLCPFGFDCSCRSLKGDHDFEDTTIVEEIQIKAPDNILTILGEKCNNDIKLIENFVRAQTNVRVHVSVKFTKRKLHAFVFKCRANVSQMNYLEDFVMDSGFYELLKDHLTTVAYAARNPQPQIEVP